jgi:hypothetical protein
MIKLTTGISELTLNFTKDDIVYFNDITNREYVVQRRIGFNDAGSSENIILPTFELMLKSGFKISTWEFFKIEPLKHYVLIIENSDRADNAVKENERLYSHIKELLK